MEWFDTVLYYTTTGLYFQNYFWGPGGAGRARKGAASKVKKERKFDER